MNPVAAISSAAMMLHYSFNLRDETRAVEEVIKRAIKAGITTGDLGGTARTGEVGDKVVEELGMVLQGD